MQLLKKLCGERWEPRSGSYGAVEAMDGESSGGFSAVHLGPGMAIEYNFNHSEIWLMKIQYLLRGAHLVMLTDALRMVRMMLNVVSDGY